MPKETLGVSQVVAGLYIGGAFAVSQAAALQEADITHLLKLYFSGPDWPDEFAVCHNSLSDGEFVSEAQFQYGVSFIRDQREAGHSVLVVCRMGISRSSTFVLAYLVGELGYDLHDAWRLLQAQHPDAWPAPQMWASLLKHYQLPYTMDDITKWLEEMP